MMKTILFLAALILGAATAHAQTVSVDIHRAKLIWTWEPAPDSGTVDEFKAYCGPAVGNYTKITSISPTLREAPLKGLISGAGTWTCMVTAANAVGETEGSNAIFFDAAVGPAGKVGVTLIAK